MHPNAKVQIDVEAAKVLTQWKALFADAVCEHAKRLAAQSVEPNSVTLTHYRQAAKIAMQSLSAAIHEGAGHDAERDVA